MRILACVDSSSYAPAVCDYAAWLAGPLHLDITLMHVSEGPAANGEDVLEAAAARLRDHGLEGVSQVRPIGEFTAAAVRAAESHSIVVAGKRGVQAEGDRFSLGGHIGPLLRGMERPLCLVSSLFLPISRILILLDGDPDHRRTVDFVKDQPWLTEIGADVVVLANGGRETEKLEWARRTLEPTGAEIYPLLASGPHDVLDHYRRERPIDLLVVSREVALVDDAEPLRRIEAGSLWAWRAPILVC